MNRDSRSDRSEDCNCNGLTGFPLHIEFSDRLKQACILSLMEPALNAMKDAPQELRDECLRLYAACKEHEKHKHANWTSTDPSPLEDVSEAMQELFIRIAGDQKFCVVLQSGKRLDDYKTICATARSTMAEDNYDRNATNSQGYVISQATHEHRRAAFEASLQFRYDYKNALREARQMMLESCVTALGVDL